MSELPSTSSSSSSLKFTYDVFLNFRGDDTRHGFTGNLYKALCDKGFHTFFDDEELRKGEEITPALVKAIQESRIAITVFSKNYASSSFCLDELVKIMECIKAQGRTVLPLFYDVDPCDVRYQRGTYGEALAQGRFKEDKEKVQKWREALRQAANLSGNDFKLGNEFEYVFMDKIIKEVSKIISRVPLKVEEHPIGLESRLQKVYSLLNDGPDDGVHMVGIYGIGGIGKSTLARAVYNSIVNQFDSSCFLGDVRDDYVKHGLQYLQEKLLSKVVGDNNIKLGSYHEGISIIKKRLYRKKVLLVLDNVDNCDQMKAIAGGPDWFGPGSRVIITTRGQDLLINHGIERKYEVECLNKIEACELFTWHAFKNDEVDPIFTKVINQAITYASGLPLALEVIGSNLFRQKEIEAWESELNQYRKIPLKKIQNILKVSFDALEEVHQNIFLDIACCFRGCKLKDIEEILHAHYGVSVKYGINILVEKSLIKIVKSDGDRVILHDLIQDMGREIIRQESPKIYGEHSRLGYPQEILKVLQNDTGTDKIEMINLEIHYPIDEVKWNRNAFQKMQNLKTLIIGGCYLAKDVEHLPNSLRVLRWEKYPSPSLPADFHPEELAILQLPHWRFESLQWAKEPKKFVNMRVFNFDHSWLIKRIPDLSGLPNLEELSFEYCLDLIKIDKSVGFLRKLRILNATGCVKLKSFPPLKLTSLEKLSISACSSLEKFPEILGKMENVTELSLWGIGSIKEFPYSIRNLTRLRRIWLLDCRSFEFPSGIFALQELDSLSISICKRLLLPNQDEGDDEQVSSMLSSNATVLDFFYCNEPPEFLQIVLPRFPKLKMLSLVSANLTILPACIKECLFLTHLNMNHCEELVEIRGIPPNLEHVSAIACTSLSSSSRGKLLNKKWHEEGGGKMIMLPGTRIPKWFEHQRKEPSISFWFRNKFPAISLCFKKEQSPTVSRFYPELVINDKKVFLLDERNCFAQDNHIFIFDRTQTAFKDYGDEMFSENEWNRAMFSLTLTDNREKPIDWVRVQIGLHIIKERSSMDDIRFIDPLLQTEGHRLVNMGDSQSHKEFGFI